jgi:hypothetical protein
MKLTFTGPVAVRNILWDQNLCDQNGTPVAQPLVTPGSFTYRYGQSAPF